MSPPSDVTVGVVGVTGAVGKEMVAVMFRRGWNKKSIRVSFSMLWHIGTYLELTGVDS